MGGTTMVSVGLSNEAVGILRSMGKMTGRPAKATEVN